MFHIKLQIFILVRFVHSFNVKLWGSKISNRFKSIYSCRYSGRVKFIGRCVRESYLLSEYWEIIPNKFANFIMKLYVTFIVPKLQQSNSYFAMHKSEQLALHTLIWIPISGMFISTEDMNLNINEILIFMGNLTLLQVVQVQQYIIPLNKLQNNIF